MNDKDWAWEAYRKALDSSVSGTYQQLAIVLAGPAAFMPGAPTWSPTGQGTGTPPDETYDWAEYWGTSKESAEDDD